MLYVFPFSAFKVYSFMLFFRYAPLATSFPSMLRRMAPSVSKWKFISSVFWAVKFDS